MYAYFWALKTFHSFQYNKHISRCQFFPMNLKQFNREVSKCRIRPMCCSDGEVNSYPRGIFVLINYLDEFL